MGRDLGQFIALIAVGSGAVVLGLSYMAAYMIGRSHGRREEQRSPRALEMADASQRLASMESIVHGLGSSLERLRDAQRLLVAQQDHLSRKVGLTSERSAALPPMQGHHTPS
jgi:hypothetical protein